MSIKFEKLKPGMVLYDRHTYRMGNTTLRTIGEWEVRIISVDVNARTAVVSWNGNRPDTYGERSLSKLHTWSMHDPGVQVEKGLMGCVLRVKRGKKSEAAREEEGA